MPRVTKRLIYQEAVWLQSTTTTLQEIFRTALQQVPVSQRQQPIGEDAGDNEGTWRRLIHPRLSGTCYFGKLVQYTHGLKQETVKLRHQADESPDGSVGAPDGQEFSDSALYFCIKDNNVVVAQSQGLRVTQLEDFLNWLIKKKTHVLPADNGLALSSLPRRDARKLLSKNVPTAVTLSRPMNLEPEGAKQSRTISIADATIDAVQRLLGVDDLRELLPANALSEGRLRTEITLSWNSRVGGNSPDAFMRGLGRVIVRQIDEDPDMRFQIVTPGGTLTNKDVSLAESVTLEAIDGVVPVRAVYDAMVTYLLKLHSESETAG